MSFTGDLDEIVEKNENGLLGVHSSWSRVRLVDVATILNGFPFNSKYFSKSDGLPLIRIRDILGDSTDTRYTGPVPEGYWINRGDLLVGMDGDFNCAPWRGDPALLNQRVCKIAGDPAWIVPSFLARVLGGYLAAINRQTSSITVKHLSSKTIADIPLPCPPLSEQTRIADKLDALLVRVDACRERLDRVPGILKRFRQSVLAAATSGELTREWREERGLDSAVQSFQLEDAEAIRDFAFPASWTVRRLADIATITGGLTKDSKKQAAGFVELPYLRVANVQRGYLDLSEVKTIRVPPDRVSDLLLRAGDILFNEGGDIDKLGRGWIWSDELPTCVFQNHVFRVRLLEPSFEPRYFSWYGNSRGHEYFLARGKQTTNLASINKSVLSALPVAVPPAAEQLEIVRRTSELLQFADDLDGRCASAAAKVATFAPAALAKAFRGDLVPQDPNDEPASRLLDRLRARPASAGNTGKPKRGGIRGSRTNAKADTNMLTRKDVTPTHLTAILKERGSLTAEALWAASQLEIDEFYGQLKDEEAQGLLRENRGDSSTAPRFLEAVA